MITLYLLRFMNHLIKGFLFLSLLLLGLVVWQRHAQDGYSVAYLSWDDNGRSQLYAQTLNNSSPTQLTNATTDVIQFSPSPNGKQLAYVVETSDNSTEIWTMKRNGRSPQRHLICQQAICAHPVWAPDNRRLIYERREQATATQPPAASYLWWLDTKTDDTRPLLTENHARATTPRLSANGEWLAYVTPAENAIQLYNFNNGRSLSIPSQTGAAPVWHPSQDQLLFTDYNLTVNHANTGDDHTQHSHTYQQSIHLFHIDLNTNAATPLSGDHLIDDGFPSWSPDASWIAFSRTLPHTALGRQLWLMRADGSEAHPLTDELNIYHGPPTWSPDGRFLLFQRFNLYADNADPEIWLFNTTTQTFTVVAPIGMLPAWLP